MITRNIAAELEDKWRVTNDPKTTPVRSLEAIAHIAQSLLRLQIDLLERARSIWNDTALAEQVAAATDLAATVDDGEYAVGYLQKLQIMHGSLLVWLSTQASVGEMSIPETPRQMVMRRPVFGQAASPPGDEQ